MHLLYSLPHPADRLADERAGHIVRAKALIGALRSLGHTVTVSEAAGAPAVAGQVRAYRRAIRTVLPGRAALVLRDAGRYAADRRYAHRLMAVARTTGADAILETHVAFTSAGATVARNLGIPLILDDVTPPFEEREAGIGLDVLNRRAFKANLAHAHRLIAVSGVIARHLVDEGADPAKVVVAGNGFDPARFAAADAAATRRRRGIPPDALVMLFVGSFQPYHRAERLIEAAAPALRTGQSRLLMVGDGAGAPACRDRARALGIGERIIWTGRQAHDAVPDLIAAADLAIMPATNSYGDPMKLYEYMAAGKAIIAPDVAPVRAILEDRATALLVDPESREALAAAVDRLCRDPDLRRRLGHTARQRSAAHTWTERARRILLESGLAAGERRPAPGARALGGDEAPTDGNRGRTIDGPSSDGIGDLPRGCRGLTPTTPAGGRASGYPARPRTR
ncbi:MAG: glycosyltransferase [Alphaproteobacteria bacterium]|jgi:glycosyltransferase involved in cell wall biosynthesis|nr:glycosyltransferase [Alphaproteobacteria bacterium]